jgi:hypothetical protein
MIHAVRKKIREWRIWERKQEPFPSHSTKQKIVKEYAKRFAIHTMIETGTYLGEMVEGTMDTFSRIFSIELDHTLYEQAAAKFSRFKHISIFEGDSADVLPEILSDIKEPCLFWLDGHFSGGITARGKQDTPVVQELQAIFNHSIHNHIILVDDARLFTGDNSYPSLEELGDMIYEIHPDWIIKIREDIIRIHR